MAKFCKNCGMQLEDGSAFCPGCGAQMEGQAPPPEPQAQYAPPPPPEPQAQYAPPPQGQQQYAPPPQGQQQYAPPPQGQGGGFDKIKDAFTNTNDETAYIHPDDIAQNKMWGGLAYILFFLPLIGAPNSRYGRFHANQGLLFLIIWVIVTIVRSIVYTAVFYSALHTWTFYMNPGYIIANIIFVILFIFIAVIGIIGLINGFTGKAKELPFVGKFRIIKMK